MDKCLVVLGNYLVFVDRIGLCDFLGGTFNSIDYGVIRMDY